MEDTKTTSQSKRSPIRWSKRSSNWKRHLEEFQKFQEQKNIVRRSYSIEHDESIPSIDPGIRSSNSFTCTYSVVDFAEDDTENSDDSETVIIEDDEPSIDNFDDYSTTEQRRRSGYVFL